MYIEKLNNNWTSFISCTGFHKKIRMSNTAKLKGLANQYMLEFIYNDLRYHLYQALDNSDYELRILNETYEITNFEDIFGMEEDQAAQWIALIQMFMMQQYEGIQTSVDCTKGIEQAKKAILKARL